MAFRLLDQLPQYTTALGELAAGGSLTFSITGTSTAKSVYAEPALSTDLGSTITLDSDARHSEDLWLAEDSAYRVILKDSDGVTIWQRDNVRALDTAESANLPDAADGTDGQALFTDGTEGGWYFDDVLAIPSQTGNDGKYLTTDGAALSWATPETFDSDNLPGGVTSTSTQVVIGNTMILCGSGTASTNGTIRVTSSVTFATAFTAAPKVVVTPTIGAVTGDSPAASCSAQATSIATTGFTAEFFAGAENNGGETDITSNVTYNWIAMGEYNP